MKSARYVLARREAKGCDRPIAIRRRRVFRTELGGPVCLLDTMTPLDLVYYVQSLPRRKDS